MKEDQDIIVRKCAVCDKETETTWKEVSRWLRNNPGRPLDTYLCSPCATRYKSKTHGESKTVLYARWKAMFARTRGQGGEIARKYYFEKGITVCPEWYDFPAFRDWAMANGFNSELQLDRINGDGNYEPSNCRWITQEENIRNKSDWELFISRCRLAALKRRKK